MICTHNILSGKVKLDAEKVFTFIANTMGGHNHKMQKKRMTKTTSLNVFSVCIIYDWNNLPAKIETLPTTNSFKNNLNEHLKEEMFRTQF